MTKETIYGPQLFTEVPAGPQREAMLEANCLRTEEMDVKQHYSPEKLADMRREYVEKMTELNKLQEELDRKKAEITGKMKPLAKDSAYVLGNIRRGHVEVKQQVYLFDDQDGGMMHYYDAQGELIYSRKLEPHEKQTNVVTLAHRTGTNN